MTLVTESGSWTFRASSGAEQACFLGMKVKQGVWGEEEGQGKCHCMVVMVCDLDPVHPQYDLGNINGFLSVKWAIRQLGPECCKGTVSLQLGWEIIS